ncbi:MAG: transcriptional regulator, TetR family [Phycisphaerales bacterium]|nr:transcriptional regulator, TetR family [Phycisphaerales bacterium]
MASTKLKSASELFGRPPPPNEGRERLIATAIDLFYRNGFGAVGIDRVIAAAGVTKTTFYKHFESKDDLMLAAVLRRDEWESQALQQAIRKRGGTNPAGQLLAMIDVMDEWFNDPNFLGCMFINAAAEFPNPHDPVHQAAAAYKHRSHAFYRGRAIAAGADEQAATTFADCFTVLIEGALIMRQTHGRNDAARAVRPMVEQLISQYLPKSQSPKSRSREKAKA